jgi:DNA-binding transcriptional ArsR family regulator
VNQLAELLSSRGRAEIFRLLFGPVGGELHVRELERQTGLSDATVRQELKKLSRLGVVDARRDGNRRYYRANDAHPLYPDIRNLVLKTSGLTDVLREALGGAEDIELAFVFGSVAGDSAKAHSDIDLMVIGTIGLRQLSKRLSGLEAKLGREVNPHVLTPEEFARRVGERDHFITAVLKGSRLFVAGGEDELRRLGK